jgi:hypothetical protein
MVCFVYIFEKTPCIKVITRMMMVIITTTITINNAHYEGASKLSHLPDTVQSISEEQSAVCMDGLSRFRTIR